MKLLKFTVFFMVLPLSLWAEVKIGYIDLNRVINESQAGKEIKREFMEYMNSVQSQLRALQEEIRSLREEIQTKGRFMDEKTLKEKRLELERKMSDYKILYQDAQRELRERDQKASEKVMGILKRIVEKLGKEEGYTIILEKTQSAVLYASPKIDLTDKVLKLFDEAYKKSKSKGKK